MRYQAEKIRQKDYCKPMFLLFRRYCSKCNLAFWLEKVPSEPSGCFGDCWPCCPDCGKHLYLGETERMRIKR